MLTEEKKKAIKKILKQFNEEIEKNKDYEKVKNSPFKKEILKKAIKMSILGKNKENLEYALSIV